MLKMTLSSKKLVLFVFSYLYSETNVKMDVGYLRDRKKANILSHEPCVTTVVNGSIIRTQMRLNCVSRHQSVSLGLPLAG